MNNYQNQTFNKINKKIILDPEKMIGCSSDYNDFIIPEKMYLKKFDSKKDLKEYLLELPIFLNNSSEKIVNIGSNSYSVRKVSELMKMFPDKLKNDNLVLYFNKDLESKKPIILLEYNNDKKKRLCMLTSNKM